MNPPSLDSWSWLSMLVQVMGALALLILGWLWSRITRVQDDSMRAHVRITEIEKSLLNHRADISKDYPTRLEVRAILEDLLRPLHESQSRTEEMIDALVRYHMQDHNKRSTDPSGPTPPIPSVGRPRSR